MAASSVDKDYVHLVANELDKRHDYLQFIAVNFAGWEIMGLK